MIEQFKQPLPICVDLDGTLVRTNTLVEALLILLKQNPLLLFLMLIWLLRGKIYFKRAVASRVKLSAAALPYNQVLLTYLRDKAAEGHELYLMTAAPTQIAQVVATHLALFTDVISTTTINLAGSAKAAAAVERFGEKKYIYAGNSRVDTPVWARSAGAIVVNASAAVLAAAGQVAPVVLMVPPQRLTFKIMARVLRSHQWVKNVLVFVPLVAAHEISMESLGWAGLSFVAFCLVSSSVYVVNDLLDLPADRLHPTKRQRPFAAGDVSVWVGITLAPLLLVSGLYCGFVVSYFFLSWLLAYLILTTGYSFYLKRIAILDVVILGLLYTLRIFAGATAVAVVVSTWLLVFSLFLFMSLAFLKRFTELLRLPEGGANNLVGRGYHVSDTAPIGGLGMASGYSSVLVLALYISSEEITRLYVMPQLLWFMVPILIYWISRLWVLAYRGKIHDDPVVFAMRDTMSYVLLGMSLLTVFVAT